MQAGIDLEIVLLVIHVRNVSISFSRLPLSLDQGAAPGSMLFQVGTAPGAEFPCLSRMRKNTVPKGKDLGLNPSLAFTTKCHTCSRIRGMNAPWKGNWRDPQFQHL